MSSYPGVPAPASVMGFDPFAAYAVDETMSGSRGRESISRSGTAADPYVIDAAGAVWDDLIVLGSYVVLKNGRVQAPDDDGLDAYRCNNCVIKDFEVAGPQINVGHGSAVGIGDRSMWLRGSIHNFGDRNYQASENDLHGIKTLGTDQWIWEAHIYEVSGDSVQIGDTSRGSATRVYVAGGQFHGNRENCLDVKDSQDIVLSNFLCYDQLNPNDEFGVVIHDDAFDAQVIGGMFSNVNYGIVSSGQSGHVIADNNIQALVIGIQLRNTSNITVIDNILSAPTPCENQGNVSGTLQSECD